MPQVVDPNLTALQLEIYEYVRTYWLSHGYAPTQREIQLATHCSGTAVRNAMRALGNGKHITTQRFVERSITPVDLQRTLVRYPPDPWENLGED